MAVLGIPDDVMTRPNLWATRPGGGAEPAPAGGRVAYWDTWKEPPPSLG